MIRYAALIFASALIAAESAPDLAEATRALYRGDLSRAQSVAADYQHDYDANYGLGACSLGERKAQAAIGWFRRAAATEPDSVAARMALGIAYLRDDKAAEAVTELKAAIALEPESRQTYVLLG